MRFFVCLAILLLFPPVARTMEYIELPSDDKPIRALLYRPDGEGPFPAVVALHGCDGLLKDSSARPLATIDAWGRYLSAAGFVVLFPDSYASRGLKRRQCRVRVPNIRPHRERVADIRMARDWLQQQDFIRKDRIALLGWANGGIAALWAVRPNLAPNDERPDFRSAVALYPGCRRLGDTAWSARVPTLILIGALDDWTPAKNCEAMVAGARGRSARATLIKYKGAHHYFDRENLRLRQRRGVAFTPDGSGRVTVGTQAEARADALKRVPEWLSR